MSSKTELKKFNSLDFKKLTQEEIFEKEKEHNIIKLQNELSKALDIIKNLELELQSLKKIEEKKIKKIKKSTGFFDIERSAIGTITRINFLN